MQSSDRWVLGFAWIAYFGMLAWLGDPGGSAWSEWRKDANLAAWVQAFASIGTLIVGVVVVWWQLNRQREAAIDDEVSRLDTLSVMAFDLTVELQFLRRSLMQGKCNFDLVRSVRNRCQVLRSLPLFEVPGSRVAAHLASANGVFEVFDAFAERLGRPPDSSTHGLSDIHREWVTEVDYVLGQAHAIELSAARAVASRGRPVSHRTYRDARGEVVHQTPHPDAELSVPVRNR